jgi:CheY-like chemotaxis protein
MFTMTLPTSAPSLTAADDGRLAHPHAERPVIPDLRGTSILAVDDDDDALTMVRDILEASGATVVTAHSASDALQALTEFPPNVLIADLGMPGVDGFELVQKVRAHLDPKVSQVPAAALTAFARSEDRARALQSGFDLHLAKPIDPEALMAAVAQLRARGRLARIL